MMIRPIVLLAALLAWVAPARAAEPYLHGFDAVGLLPPPPPAHGVEDKADRDLAFQVYSGRTADEIATARAEHKVTIFAFTPAVGPWFTKEKLPKTDALFRKVEAESKKVLDSAKEVWNRPRPFVDDPKRFSQPADPEKSASYPSGHSTRGTVFALLLAQMLPEHEAAILEKGRQIGWVRVEAGVHTPLDIYAGRVLGQALAGEFLANPQFQKDLAEAKAECEAAKVQASGKS